MHALKVPAKGPAESMKRGEWFTRLQAAVEEALQTERVTSKRDLSTKAGLGINYVSQMIRDEKGPSAEAVVRLAKVMDVSLVWIFVGAEMDSATERLVALFAPMTPERKRALLDLLDTKLDPSAAA